MSVLNVFPCGTRLAQHAVLVVALALYPGIAVAGITWHESWHVHVNGQHVSVRTFTSRLSPVAAMQRLAQLHPVYAHYQIADGRILLSGVKEGAHWVAEIHGHPEGAQGYVSALYFSADGAASGVPPAAWNSLGSSSSSPGPRVFDFDGATVRLPGAGADAVDIHFSER